MKSFMLAMMVLLSAASFSQKKIPSFGKIEVADLKMTDCDFDKGAEAMVLLDHGDLSFERGTEGISLFKTFYDRRIRIKILKEKGMSYANVEVPFYSHNNEEKIVKIDALTYNLDEKGKVKTTDVSKSSIYIKKINKRVSRLVIAFPEVKVGSVIEYKFRLERDRFTDIKDWYFQSSIPTRYSEYEARIPEILKFSLQSLITDSIDYTNKTTTDVVNIGSGAYEFKVLQQNFIMRNLVGIGEEAYMASAKDYIQHIEFQLSQIDQGNNHVQNFRTSWTDVVKALNADEDFGLQLNKGVNETSELIKQAVLIADKEKRIQFIFNEVRKRMAVKNNEALYTNEDLSKAWAGKSGNVVEINLILVSLLNKAGMKASPIILSTRDNGTLNVAFHSLTQFNVVMAFASTDDKNFVLDATDKVSHY